MGARRRLQAHRDQPSLEFHLHGKNVFDVLSGAGVPEEAYEYPRWSNQGAFVLVWPPVDAQGKAAAMFVSPVVSGVPTPPRETRYYDLTAQDAVAAAADIARFLA